MNAARDSSARGTKTKAASPSDDKNGLFCFNERTFYNKLGRHQIVAMQKEQFDLFRRQLERSERIQDRAEELQARGAGIMNTARRSLAFVLPVVILLIAYLTWLIFR
jgi:hypothetical protein